MIIKFDPKSLENKSKYFNEIIEKNEDENYIMFIFNDIYDALKDPQDFYKKYVDLLKTFNLPYAFYPYYLHFNKALKSYISFGNPRMRIKINNKEAFDVVNQTAYGMLILNTKLLKSINFKFDENYGQCFYIQQLIEECFKNNLTLSSNWFFDVYNSFLLVNSNLKDGYYIDQKSFVEEKTKFYTKYKQTQEPVQEFIEKLNKKCIEYKELGVFA